MGSYGGIAYQRDSAEVREVMLRGASVMSLPQKEKRFFKNNFFFFFFLLRHRYDHDTSVVIPSGRVRRRRASRGSPVRSPGGCPHPHHHMPGFRNT
jgi:hypothetical protein